VLVRERATARRREDARTVGRPGRAPAAERQVRVKFAPVKGDAVNADARGQLVMQRPELIEEGFRRIGEAWRSLAEDDEEELVQASGAQQAW
jgi:hypothetical protein